MTRSIPVAIAALFIMSCTSAVSQSQVGQGSSLDRHQKDKIEAPSATSTTADESAEPEETGSDGEESEKPDEVIIVTEVDAPTSTPASSASSRTTAVTSSTSIPAATAPAATSHSSISTAAIGGESASASTPTSASSTSTQEESASTARTLRPASVLEILSSGAASVLRELQTESSTSAGATSSSSSASTPGASTTISGVPAASSPVASSSSSTITEETATPRQPRTSAEVFRAVEQLEGLRGWTVIPFAHFQREDRHVVVAWPALNSSGRLVDATVVGVCLEEGDTGGLVECGRRWVVRDRADSRAALVNALGGSDYRVMTASPGAELDDLGPRVSELGTAFSQAVSSGNRSQARSAAIQFTRLLPVSEAAFDNQVAQLLYLAGAYNGRLEHAGTVRNGDSATLTFHVYRSILRVRTIRATAREIGDTGRWHIVSYQ